LFSIDWVKFCQGFIPVSVTHIVPVGWVKPLAAYPAKTRTGWKAPKDVIDFQHRNESNTIRANHAEHRDTGKADFLPHRFQRFKPGSD
jgi:hypothetical protein